MKNRTHRAWQQPTEKSMEDNYYLEAGYQGKKLRIEFDYIDPDMDDFKIGFESILTFLTFDAELIKELFAQEDMVQKQCLEDMVCNSGHGMGCDV
jgi:hypothetical protein